MPEFMQLDEARERLEAGYHELAISQVLEICPLDNIKPLCDLHTSYRACPLSVY